MSTARYQRYFFRDNVLVALTFDNVYRSVNDPSVALIAFNKVRLMFKGILFSSVIKLFSLRINVREFQILS